MPFRHIAVCLLTCLLWSGNFIAVKFGLDGHMTPLLMTAMRFMLASCLLPLFPRPAGMRWSSIATIGLLVGVGQFGLATLSVAAGLSAGVAALVLQMRVLITIGLAAGFLHEPITSRILVGSAVSLLGVGLLVAASFQGSASLSMAGLLLALGAACGAALSNVLIKNLSGKGNAIRLAVWISPFPILPLLGLSALTEGNPFVIVSHANMVTSVSVIVYGGLISAVGGTALWSWLLRRHPASRVALFTPAIPVFAFALSTLLFGQRPELYQVIASALVILGLLITSAKLPQPARPSTWRKPETARQSQSVTTQ